MAPPQQTPEDSKISLLLLGRFGLRLGSGERISISLKKGCALIGYLAMQPEHAASREQLATLLWGDRSDELARQNLRQCLLTLRREMPPAAAGILVVSDDIIALNPQSLTIDAREFALLADANELSALARACELYVGPFFSGVSVDAEAFEEWVRAERERLESVAARVFTSCAQACRCGGKRRARHRGDRQAHRDRPAAGGAAAPRACTFMRAITAARPPLCGPGSPWSR